MSGHQTKLIYDNCTYMEKIKSSTWPLNYNFFRGKYENNQDRYCSYIVHDNKINNTPIKPSFCMPICKNNGVIKNNISSIGKRTDIESSLKLIKEPYSSCWLEKNALCSLKYPNKNSLCNIESYQNAYLCERNINPTNSVNVKSISDFKKIEKYLSDFAYF